MLVYNFARFVDGSVLCTSTDEDYGIGDLAETPKDLMFFNVYAR